MIQGFINKVFGTRHDREMKKLQPHVARIGELGRGLVDLDDDTLKAKTAEFKQKIENGASLDSLQHEAFAVCREAAWRTLHMRHYDVQLIGGMILHRGSIAEMRTGEGKTLTATLAVYLNALAGKGVHLVTVNDYLAARDAEWMGQIYRWLGMEVGTILANMAEEDRRKAYQSDITYGTNNEFGFDYLRDNMKYQLDRRVQRALNYAIVDEVDSILIDEARTPLIISGQDQLDAAIYREIDAIVRDLKRDEDYVVNEEHRSATLTDDGIEKVEERLEIENLFQPEHVKKLHHVIKALEAHTLYRRDEQYMVVDGKVVIVDEFTGRPMDGRRWSDGLHQAVEAKEGVEIKAESVTLATITYQNFFRMYEKLSGMTGTADTEAEEFQNIYNLQTTVIPTNKPIARIDNGDLVYRTEREKFAAIVDQILECHENGQPVLVGTVSVDKSEVISKVLKKKNIAHSVLNAKYHGQEADIIAQAGRKGAVTIATNMAGRGTDILLGGNPEALAERINDDHESDEFTTAFARFQEICAKERQEVLDAGGLFILGTERHDSRRIDNQLRGRAGRQGDPGESRFFLSLEDDLMRRFGADKIQGLMVRLGMEEGVPIEAGMVSKSIENAQKKVEGRNFDIRKHLLEYDDVMDVQRKTIYELRRKILEGEDLDELILDAFASALESLIDQYANANIRVDEWDMSALATAIGEYFDIEVAAEELPENGRELELMLWKRVRAKHKAQVERYEEFVERYNAARVDQEDAEEMTAARAFQLESQRAYMHELDRLWRDHLNAMRALRESVGLHGYAQRDPKQIYKKEGYGMFRALQSSINLHVAQRLMRMAPPAPTARITGAAALQAPAAEVNVAAQRQAAAARQATARELVRQAVSTAPRRALPKLGRNDPCWCGSGKKYKHCHLRKDQDAARSEGPDVGVAVDGPAAATGPAPASTSSPAPASASGTSMAQQLKDAVAEASAKVHGGGEGDDAKDRSNEGTT